MVSRLCSLLFFHLNFPFFIAKCIFVSAAERNLNEAQKLQGHSLQVLHIVASDNAADAAVRQAAAVHFKNLCKNGWDTNSDVGRFLHYLNFLK
jgi:hypothetical protein